MEAQRVSPLFIPFLPFGQERDVKRVAGGGSLALHRHDCFHSEGDLFKSHTSLDRSGVGVGVGMEGGGARQGGLQEFGTSPKTPGS